LLERRGLSPSELRILLAVRNRDVTVRELARRFDRRPVEVRRTGARLFARGLLGWRQGSWRDDVVLGITRDGAATLGPLLADSSAPSSEGG
jgi:hypothetical protein